MFNMKTPERSVEEIVEEFESILEDVGVDDLFLDNDDGRGTVVYDGVEFLTKTFEKYLQAERQKREEMVEAERERILNKLSDQSLHSEVIFKVLGAGHHYSTMPVVAGIVSRLKETLTQPNNT